MSAPSSMRSSQSLPLAPTTGALDRLRASLGIGVLELIVPDDAVVTLDAHVGGGELCAFDLHDRGTDIFRRTAARRERPAPSTCARVGLGSVVVVDLKPRQRRVRASRSQA